jgi:energy-converting hydrogenase B subunit Q
MGAHAILCTVLDRPGMLSDLTRVLADHQANITHVDIHPGTPSVGIYLEFTLPDDPSTLREPPGRPEQGRAATGSGSPRAESRDDRFDGALTGLRGVSGVTEVGETPSFAKIYGKRIIVMGGGAQVGQVAMGAITEADRHNIRGERISVDTIPLVGEKELAAAVRATARLPRVKMLVLAGALMGGDIATAVEEVRASGLGVISLNMAGSVPDAADLVVSDPVQAGVMAVMAVADTAKFDLMRQLKRRY